MTIIERTESAHVHQALMNADLRRDPWEHVVVNELFSPEFYATLTASFPREHETFGRQSALDPLRYFGNHDRRLELRFPMCNDWLLPHQRAFWLPFIEYMSGPEFGRMLVERFRPQLLARFGEELDAPDFTERRLEGRFILTRHEPEYYLGPHTDLREKVVTLVFYMPEHGGLEHLGTSLYTPRDPRFRSDGTVHHDPALFELAGTVPFRANSAFAFARGDATFHGVEKFTADALQGSAREGFQLSFYERNLSS
jgi:hypothetical protein